MPWTPQSFRQKHNKKLSPEQAAHAARIANAMLKRGVGEGESIATANARVKGQKPQKHDKPFGSLAP